MFMEECTFREIIYQSTNFVREIQITGGEPMLHHNLVNFLNFAQNFNFRRITVNTNATILPSDIDELKVSDKLIFQVGLDAASPQTYNIVRKSRNGKNYFFDVIRNIKLLVKKGFRVSLSFTINKINVSEVEKFIELAQQLGVEEVRMSRLRIFDKAFSDMKFFYEKKLLRDLKDKLRKYKGIEIVIPDGIRINACLYSCTITPNGDVIPCYFLRGPVMGNIRQRNILDIWNNYKFKVFRTEFLKCPFGR